MTDEPGTGRVTLRDHVPRGEVPRDDVAAVLIALLTSGGAPVVAAVRSFAG